MQTHKVPQLVVQKFGGATLADPQLLKAAAQRVYLQSKKTPLIVVVSAMGTTTNSLIQLAQQVSQRPARRELDMLLSVGERISMALMSMALQDLGASAISFTGSQAGILTDDDHFNAKIIDVKAHRVYEALTARKIVILAGFQGVSPETKEITTLGRGGSDVTAVAMAAAFGAHRCEILKEVPAILTADPKIVPTAKPLSQINYRELLDMTFWGAKVLHHRSVELARAHKVELYIGPAADEKAHGTLVKGGANMYENHRPLSINSHERVIEVELSPGDVSTSVQSFYNDLHRMEIPIPQVLSIGKKQDKVILRATASNENLDAIQKIYQRTQSPRLIENQLCSLTLTCSGGVSAELSIRALEHLRAQGITPFELFIGPSSLTVFLNAPDRQKGIEALHSLIPPL